MNITSLQHPLVKHWTLLKKESNYRKETQKVLLIGENIIREYPFPIRCLISKDPSSLKSDKTYIVSEQILQKIAGLGHFEGLIAEVDLPQEQNLDEKQFLLILDQIQDPGNLGTLLRTALALGWEGVIATPGTVDFFNDKAIRSSQGAIFRLPFSYKTEKEIQDLAQKKGIVIWVGDAKAISVKKQTFQAPLCLVLSHEGQGIRTWAQQIGKKVSIPLQNDVESLNVAVAGAILLYEMRGFS